jgi:hypothetical protein
MILSGFCSSAPLFLVLFFSGLGGGEFEHHQFQKEVSILIPFLVGGGRQESHPPDVVPRPETA